MADIRFKISGNTEPFLAQLWDSTCSTLIQQKSIEYSGATVIFGTLDGNTCYNLKISDGIGTSISQGFTTLSQLIPPVLSTKTISLLGTLNSPTESSQQMVSPKCITITPSLVAGESVDLMFNVSTCDVTLTDNQINLYCNNTLSQSYYNQNTSDYYCVNIKNGDTFCYDMVTNSNGIAGSCGYASLNLTGVTGYNFNATRTSPTCKSTNVSIAEPTTTESPVTVFLTNFTQTSGDLTVLNNCSAKLGTSRPLLSGESFKLYFTDYSYSCTGVALPKAISTYACASPPTSYNASTSNVPVLTVSTLPSEQTCYAYLTIDSSNYNGITFNAKAQSHGANSGYLYANFASIALNSIVDPVGANFQLAGTTSIDAYNQAIP